jgi:mRNA interferase MazF
MAFPQRGYCYWVQIPGEPHQKRRPALVLSPNIRNQLAFDVIVLPLSTVLREAPTHVRLRKGEGGLPKPSMVKCEQITTVRKDRLSPKPLGTSLSRKRLVEVEKAILRAIDVPMF